MLPPLIGLKLEAPAIGTVSREYHRRKCVGPAFSTVFKKGDKRVILLADVHDRPGLSRPNDGLVVDEFFAEALNDQATALVLEESPRVPEGYNVEPTGYLSLMRLAARKNRHSWKVENVDVRLAYPMNGRRGSVTYKLGMGLTLNSKPMKLSTDVLEKLRKYLLEPGGWGSDESDSPQYLKDYARYLGLAGVKALALNTARDHWEAAVERVSNNLAADLQDEPQMENGMSMTEYVEVLRKKLEAENKDLQELKHKVDQGTALSVAEARNLKTTEDNVQLLTNAIEDMEEELSGGFIAEVLENAVGAYSSIVVDLHALRSVFKFINTEGVNTIVVYMGAAHTARLAAFMEASDDFTLEGNHDERHKSLAESTVSEEKTAGWPSVVTIEL